MALILLVKVQSWVSTAKCSEPQVGISNLIWKYLGFTFLKNGGEWKVKPTTEKKKKLKKKLSEYLKRNKAVARPLAVTIRRV